MHKLFCILVIAHTFKSAHNIVINNNPCPSRPIQENFDLIKYFTNSWYEISRYDVPLRRGCSCGFSSEIISNTDNTIRVQSCCKRNESTTFQCDIVQAKLSQPDRVLLEGKLNAALDNQSNDDSNYWILSTDYDNYSLVYYCSDIPGNKSMDVAWLLARKPQLTANVKVITDALINQYLDSNAMYHSDQNAERCEPYPKALNE